jgi:spermidine/putrescine transport system ATP-binding protein
LTFSEKLSIILVCFCTQVAIQFYAWQPGQTLPAARQKGEWSMPVASVELQNVTKRFGDVMAVDDVSLRVGEGEFFSLLGPSGCGKTTTLRLIAGFEMPTAGEIYLKDKPVADLPPFARNVNTVFQDYALFPHMTVAKNIAFGLEMKRQSKAEIKEGVERALAMVHLPGMADRRPSQLSGGQQQRVALARAIDN